MSITIPVTANDIGRVTVTTSSANSTINMQAPVNVQDGDDLILVAACNSTLNPNSFTLPDGTWTASLNTFSRNGSFNPHVLVARRKWNTGNPTSWELTIGAHTSDDQTLIFRARGVDATTPVEAFSISAGGDTGVSPICPSLTTLTAGAMAIFLAVAKNGSAFNALDTGNPAGTTLISSKNTRAFSAGINVGLAYEERSTVGATGTRTWANFTTSNQYWQGISFALRPAPPSQAIDSVNGGDPVVYGESFTWSTSGFSPAPNAATIAGVACSSVSGSGGTAPALNDGATVPMPGTRQLTGSNGTQSASINKVVAVADGLFARELVGTPNTGAGSVVVGFSPAAKAGDYIVHPTTNNTSVDDKGRLKTDNEGTMNFVHISVDEGNSNIGIAYTYQVITGADGSLVVVPSGKYIEAKFPVAEFVKVETF